MLLVIIGGVLLMPGLQTRLAVAGGPVGNFFDQRFQGASFSGAWGQLGAGLLLGAVWSPCVGPTLGAALLLAAQQRALPQVALTMLLFGLGAGLPLAALGFLSREALLRWRQRLGNAGKSVKAAFGVLLVRDGRLDPHRSRQGDRDGARQRLAGLADAPHDELLTSSGGLARAKIANDRTGILPKSQCSDLIYRIYRIDRAGVAMQVRSNDAACLDVLPSNARRDAPGTGNSVGWSLRPPLPPPIRRTR